MSRRLLPCAGLALLANLSLAQFVLAKPDKAEEAALKAEIKRFGWTRFTGDSRLLRAAARVRPDRPLDVAKATILARAYFSVRSGGCGGVGSPVDWGTFWSFSTKEDAAGRSGATIKVAKATGRTFSQGFVTVARPSDFARYVLPDAALKRRR